MRELLLAYLFGQLDADERAKIERALAERPYLREELCRLRQCLGADAAATEVDEATDPPPNLVERTCARIATVWQRAAWGAGELVGVDALSQTEVQPRFTTGGRDRGPQVGSRCSLGDLGTTASVACVLAMLLFPALLNSRGVARVEQCKDHLRVLSQAVFTFARAHNGFIPHIPAEGREAFAGYFAIQVRDGGYMDAEELGPVLICPATIEVDDWQNRRFLLRMRVPTLEQLAAVPAEHLPTLQRELASSYAYRFGYLDDNRRYTRWRLDYSKRSAILADAPSLYLPEFQSANHAGRGQNVSFADGHVEFLCHCPKLGCGDHLFKNRDGYRAAACGKQDNVLGRSEDGPAVPDFQPLLLSR